MLVGKAVEKDAREFEEKAASFYRGLIAECKAVSFLPGFLSFTNS